MKLAAFEVRRMAQLLAADQLPQAITLLRRVGRIQRLLVAQLDLLDTMSPKAYITVRAGLGRGSGQESPGFRTLLGCRARSSGRRSRPSSSAAAWRSATIYQEPDEHHDLLQLCRGPGGL